MIPLSLIFVEIESSPGVWFVGKVALHGRDEYAAFEERKRSRCIYDFRRTCRSVFCKGMSLFPDGIARARAYANMTTVDHKAEQLAHCLSRTCDRNRA